MNSTILTRIRKLHGLSLAAVAAKVGTDPSNLWRVELGRQLPSRELARALFKFYDGGVELGAIYDPVFASRQASKTTRAA